MVLSLLESSRPPRLPTGSWYYRGQLRKSRRWRQAAQAADVRDAGPGPERAQPGAFQSWILLPCGHPFVHHPRTGQTEGQSTGSPRAQLPLSLGNITAFQCQSHFKLISLCIMFFKSFLNKTKIQSVSFPWDVGTRIRFWVALRSFWETGCFAVSGRCPMHLICRPKNQMPPLSKRLALEALGYWGLRKTAR